MATGDFQSEGDFTISKSLPSVVASVVVTDGSVTATSNIVLIRTSVTRDVDGSFTYSVVAGAGDFTVTANREQLPEDVTFNYMSFEGA